MATLNEIMIGVQRELSYAGGRNVQILMQDRIGNMINRMVRTLSSKYWWEDQFRSVIVNLDGTGDIVTSIKDKIFRLKDIHSVYLNEESEPLSWTTKGQNIAQIRAKCLYPAPTDRSPFMLLPINTPGYITVNYRIYTDADLGLDDEVPLDKDLIILGVASSLAVSDGLNDTHAQMLASQYADHLKTLVMSEVKSKYVATKYGYDPVTEWTPR